MEDSPGVVLSRVKSAAIDGRLLMLRFRQKQFLSLHKHLSNTRKEFLEAAQTDDECTKEEAQIAFASTLIELRNHYDALDFEIDLDQEYSMAKGKSNETRRMPIKITYIIPDTLCVLFSVIAALCGALEAGSCCIVELENTTRKTTLLLRRLFLKSLDNEAFGIISSRAPTDLLSQCVVVDQAQKFAPVNATSVQRLLVSPVASNIAVVDRTGNIKLAAKEIVASRMALSGRGRYAVDLVLVNEFMADELLEAVVEALTRYQDVHKDVKIARRKGTATVLAVSVRDTGIEEEIKQQTVKLHHGDSEIGVVEHLERTSSITTRKSHTRIILVHKITSLDDVIDMLNEGDAQSAIGALYLFAASREAKYLSQYIPSQVTFCDHIPAQLLVGPATPHGYPLSLRTRYTRAMFEYPSPQIMCGPNSHLMSKILNGPKQSEWLLSVAQKPLRPTNQKTSGAWGFFEQGMIVGAIVYLLPVLGVFLVGVGYAGTFTYRRFFSM